MNLYLSAWSILSKKNQKKFFFIIFLFLLLSLLEIIGIASVIPFVTAIFSPEKISDLPILNNFVDLIEKKSKYYLANILYYFLFNISFKKCVFYNYL